MISRIPLLADLKTSKVEGWTEMVHFYDLNFGMAFTTTQAYAVRRRNEMLLSCGFLKEILLGKGAYMLCIP